MDNFRIDVTSKGRDQLDAVLGLVAAHVRARAVGYCLSPSHGLVLLTRCCPVGLHPVGWEIDGAPVLALPYPMNIAALRDFVWHYLEQADLGPEPTHDGSNSRGFRVYNEQYGHIGGRSDAFLAVQAVWAEHGK